MDDGLFHELFQEKVVLRWKGRFYQCQLYHRNHEIYAKLYAGYVRLHSAGNTTEPNMVWEGNLPDMCYIADFRVRLKA